MFQIIRQRYGRDQHMERLVAPARKKLTRA
jgi:hypothetical protein